MPLNESIIDSQCLRVQGKRNSKNLTEHKTHYIKNEMNINGDFENMILICTVRVQTQNK